MKFNLVDFNRLLEKFNQARIDLIVEISEVAIRLNHPQLDFSDAYISGVNAVITFNHCSKQECVIVIELSKFSPEYLSAYVDGYLAK